MIRKEYRDYQTAVRAADGDSRHVEGYACVFGQRSVLMMDWEHGPVYEVIEPSAITEEVLRSSDIIATIEHNPDCMLARSVNGKGTLDLTIDKHGLKSEWDCLNTADGTTCLENVRAGNYRGMSFGFFFDPDTDCDYTTEKDKDGNEIKVRHIKNVKGLFDVSVVAHPAYPETSISTRSADREALIAELEKAYNITPKVAERSKEMLRDFDYLDSLIRRSW